jgi:hypothetical protein
MFCQSSDGNEIWRIIREFLENPNSNKWENLEEMNTFLDAFNLQKLNKKDINS